MTRQAPSTNILRNILLVFTIFFLIFALLNTGLSFIFQPLFSFFISVPTFTTLALFALIMTLIIRQNCVETIPSNTVGLITYNNGALKTLAPAGLAWVWFGRERLSDVLSLESVSTHMPLIGLKSRDGEDLQPLVTIINWRIDSSITALLSSHSHRQQVSEVACETPQKRERRVRDTVATIIKGLAAQQTLDELETLLPDILHNPFGEKVLRKINDALAPLGLTADRLECIGAISLPTKASGTASIKTLSAAHKKLESLLRSTTPDVSLQGIQKHADELLVQVRQTVQEMNATSRAVNEYRQAVMNGLQFAHQHFKMQADIKAAGTAQQELSKRLNELAARINGLLEAANKIKHVSEQASHTPVLTKAEAETLFKLLDAIEQKKITLGPLFP